MNNTPHIIVVPTPLQGHVIPLTEISKKIAKQGLRVTIVNPDYVHQRLLNALVDDTAVRGGAIRLISIADGLAPEDNWSNFKKVMGSISQLWPKKLEELIREINVSDEVTCIISDMGWAMEVGKNMGIKGAFFCVTAAMAFALALNIPKLIQDGVIDSNGISRRNEMIQLSPTMPPVNTSYLPWSSKGDHVTQTMMFHYTIKTVQDLKLANRLLCNSFHELEPEAFSLVPNLIPVGPLITNHTVGHLWPEDSTCLSWLDAQPPRSVIYVAFGSTTFLDKAQFEQLARGLQLCDRPFLWVVRPGITKGSNDTYPHGFSSTSRGKVVDWAPQQKVLAHPSVGCFVSHCGWNSAVEGVSNGVPFLCLPYIADHFLGENYICNVWKVGLAFDRDQNGIITSFEVKMKLEKLFGDEMIRERCLKLKEMAMASVGKGGNSSKNFKELMEWIKE